MKNKIVGILGGLGPESTIDLFAQIVKNTPVKIEQDHLRIIIDNNPQIPCRVKAITSVGPSPLEEMEKSIRNLEKCQVDMICLPCNLVHFFYDDLQKMTRIPIIHMLRECSKYISTSMPHLRKAGLLAATPTVETRLYHRFLKEVGIEVITPDQKAQKQIMDIIFGPRGVKMGYVTRHKATILRMVEALLDSGAEAVIAGCTEIGLVMRDVKNLPVIDPIQILAKVTIKMAASPQNNSDEKWKA